jgi:hypothetical protein
LKGRLAYINKHRNNPRRSAQGHATLVQTVYYCFVKLNFALLTTFRRRGYARDLHETKLCLNPVWKRA